MERRRDHAARETERGKGGPRGRGTKLTDRATEALTWSRGNFEKNPSSTLGCSYAPLEIWRLRDTLPAYSLSIRAFTRFPTFLHATDDSSAHAEFQPCERPFPLFPTTRCRTPPTLRIMKLVSVVSKRDFLAFGGNGQSVVCCIVGEHRSSRGLPRETFPGCRIRRTSCAEPEIAMQRVSPLKTNVIFELRHWSHF